MSTKIKLWVAQGFGTGRLPLAPGTFGSLVGVLWVLVLLVPGNGWVYGFGTLGGVVISVWLAGEAERILLRHDPGSVVIDEIAAMPVAAIAAVLAAQHQLGRFPRATDFLGHSGLIQLAIAFGLFRLFDVWKPWPVRQSQQLTGGLGVTADDLLAAVYVGVVMQILLSTTPIPRF